MVEEWVRLSQAVYKILQRFYNFLKTEQCEVQVSSALARGYLYAAVMPTSILTSFRMMRAGFNTLVACFSFRHIEGAKIRGGRESLVEAGKGRKEGRYIAEIRMDELIKVEGIQH
ncbi:hypothetical protein BYT27DRAFT_7191809 [Phlegmacium glaucopus]|nr:hypothetical protein BYT27DRAFT_7191809 [Phlegmacium glaucopus]